MSHELHHFSMGAWLFFLAWLTSIAGCYVGLSCAQRAVHATDARSRSLWTLLASVSIGGVGVWLMHFVGMMGFSVPGSPVRYGLGPTALSVVLAVGATWFGLRTLQSDAAWARSASPRLRLCIGGFVMGLAVAAMHYTGMAAVRVKGTLDQDAWFVAASVAIGVVASVAALWLSGAVEHPAVRVPAAAVMACAVVALHYTGMAGVSVHLDPSAPDPAGSTVMSLMFPGFIAGIIVLALLVVMLLAAPSDEDLQREYEISDWAEHPR